jgi:putative GTP pyrophosphokinase
MKVEVQLRTIAMDFWASLEHKVRYKKNIPADEAERLAAELTDCACLSAELDKRMQDIRNRLAAAEEVPDEKGEAQRLLGSLREFANF